MIKITGPKSSEAGESSNNSKRLFGKALLLASDESSYVTGINIVVDDGMKPWRSVINSYNQKSKRVC